MEAAPSLDERKAELIQCTRKELARIGATGSSEETRLEDACVHLACAIAQGLPLRHLRACADVRDAGRLHLPARDLQLRRGPYPLFLRGFEQATIDDFTFLGDALLIGASGAISMRDGKLLVVEAHGRFSVSDQFHIVRPMSSDFAYLRHALAAIDAHRYAKGTNAARVIELADLRGAIVPWPEKAVRMQFAQVMNLCDNLGALALKARFANAWTHAARNVDLLEQAEAFVPSKSMPVEHAPIDHSGDALAVADGLLAATGAPAQGMVDVVAATADLADPSTVQRGTTCICFPPPNQGTWTNRTVDENDSRWVFGPPPRNKANFAWIQQTVACMDDRSCALMLLCNAALHSERGREADARRAWARSGLIEAVIALPGGLFADGRPPSSLVVMQKATPATGILFINALECGEDEGIDLSGQMSRRLPDEAVERIIATYAAWRNAGDYRDESGFCKAATADQVEANGCVLTPWTYV